MAKIGNVTGNGNEALEAAIEAMGAEITEAVATMETPSSGSRDASQGVHEPLQKPLQVITAQDVGYVSPGPELPKPPQIEPGHTFEVPDILGLDMAWVKKHEGDLANWDLRWMRKDSALANNVASGGFVPADDHPDKLHDLKLHYRRKDFAEYEANQNEALVRHREQAAAMGNELRQAAIDVGGNIKNPVERLLFQTQENVAHFRSGQQQLQPQETSNKKTFYMGKL